MNRVSYFIIVGILFFAVFESVGQYNYANWSISPLIGISTTRSDINNGFWLEGSDGFDKTLGNTVGLELNRRIIGGLWLSTGMIVIRRKSTVRRIDPYQNNVTQAFIERSQLGQELNLKAEYVLSYPDKLYFGSVFARRVNHLILLTKNFAILPDGIAQAGVEWGIFPNNIRKRTEIGFSVGRFLNSSHKYAVNIEPSYSYFNDFKKSPILDKMDLKSITINLRLNRYFKSKKDKRENVENVKMFSN